ncbi:chaperonin 10-like protein [Aspergillus pseudonomiae]|uniref:Chaperonin 10-like protein n=1 Tax=Aspergillus pseudonomiae TaxID=1506151 RepID=A0A5N7DLN2_9EURO|nr:chaperonin 10-like protein [Aspergillus pseudonomiae]KAB8262371.1 chaperonin 10-like protein [Aspergillus pseudonomiae]KAE8407019.1 chaperonin 10-like protein [Aspergillus pseudonomiae]
MLSINIPSYSDPSGYILSELPAPEITDSKDVLIKVHAASVNPVDLKKAEGVLKAALKDTFPYKIGYDCAGIVTKTGQSVTRVKPGDEVYVRLPESHRGAWSEYAKCPEEFIALKPPSLSFESAAAIPLAATTAFQALQKYNGDLSGKTVFVPAGLGGTGLYACQLAKHVFHAGKVITTVSTSKIPKVDELLGKGTVDQIIDYTKSEPKDAIPHGSIDFLFDTVGLSMEYLCLMRPKTSRIVSISTLPSGNLLQNSSVMRLPHRPTLPFIYKQALNLMDAARKLRARRYGVEYSYMFLEPSGKDLDLLREYVEKDQLKPVVGTTANMWEIEEVRKACQVVFNNRGGLGKVVIRVVKPENPQ